MGFEIVDTLRIDIKNVIGKDAVEEYNQFSRNILKFLNDNSKYLIQVQSKVRIKDENNVFSFSVELNALKGE